MLSKAGLSTGGWERTGCAGIILLYIHLLGVYTMTRGQVPLTQLWAEGRRLRFCVGGVSTTSVDNFGFRKVCV